MANDLNQCNFIGRLGKDPDTRYTASGDAVTNFSIAVGWKSKDKEGTEWVNCVAFKKLAEIVGEYCAKGKQVFVSGQFKTEKWQDQQGTDKYATKIYVNSVQLLGSRSDDGGAPKAAQEPQASAPPPAADFEDDIPFDIHQRGIWI